MEPLDKLETADPDDQEVYDRFLDDLLIEGPLTVNEDFALTAQQCLEHGPSSILGLEQFPDSKYIEVEYVDKNNALMQCGEIYAFLVKEKNEKRIYKVMTEKLPKWLGEGTLYLFKPKLVLTINFEIALVASTIHICGKEQFEKVLEGYEPTAADLKNRGNQLYQAKDP